MMPKRRLFVWTVLLLLPATAWGQGLQERVDAYGSVDWARWMVRAAGMGRMGNFGANGPSAAQRTQTLDAAKLSAFENLLRAVEVLRYDNSRQVRDVLQDRGGGLDRLRDLAEAFTIVDTRSMSDMSVEIEIELPIAPDVLALVLPEQSAEGRLRLSDERLCPTCRQPWPEGQTVPEDVVLIDLAQGVRAPGGAPYSGLIVDARGLGARPALLPRLIDQEGQEVYGSSYAVRETAVRSGLVGYAATLQQALNRGRSGEEPLMVRALKVAGPQSTDLVISNHDAAIIHSAAHTDNFLKSCGVIFII